MITRDKIKNLIYQALVGNAELLDWFETNYSVTDVSPYILESGSDLPSATILFPAIRYKLMSEKTPEGCDDCEDMRLVTFDIYIDSRAGTTIEGDELMEIVRRIYKEDCGRELGKFSDSAEYLAIVGSGMSLDIWDVREMANEQRAVSDEPAEFRTGLRSRQFENGTIFSFLRFQMNVADLAVE